ncbi:MAG: Uma2 family endonuclease [Hormoscilla sp. GM7CHS1pb]|nr:Uma2 family endonuclease [Hormoscilla sp. GM7CHS1pb]
MVQTPIKQLTLEEFLALPETKPASEYINGQVLQKSMPQGQHSRIQQKLLDAINAVAEPESIALALPELRCTFGGRSTVPDIALFRWERLSTNADGTIGNSFTTHLDWTIEILSPDQLATRVTRNIFHCLNHGTELGWLIDPGEELILTYNLNSPPGLFEIGNDVLLPVPSFLPHLQLTASQIFGWLRIRG